MMDIKDQRKDESAAYQKGYRAGSAVRVTAARRQEMWWQAVLQIAPLVIDTSVRYQRGGHDMTSITDRMAVAAEAADAVVDEARKRGVL